MKKWTVVLLQSKKPEGGYANLFKEYPPDKVICLHYDENNVNDPLQELTEKMGGEFFTVPIKRIENATPENRVSFNSIPFEIIRDVINALREINNEAIIGKKNLVFPIFSGSSLHAQLMLGLATTIGAEVATIDSTKEKTRTLQPQRWIRKSLSVEFNTSKQRNALRLFLIEYANIDEATFDCSKWLTGKQLTGGKGSSDSIPLDGSAIKKALQISIDHGLVEENRDAGRHLYRLTGSGWLVALNLFREAIQSDDRCPLEGIFSDEEKNKLCKRFLPNYNEEKSSPKGRIMGVKGTPLRENQKRIDAIEIANFLTHVDQMITIYSKIDDDISKGHNDPAKTLDKNISEMWNDSLELRGWSSLAETHFNAKGNLEDLFSDFSMWAWISMHNKSTSYAIEWEMDITQFDKQQNLTCGLFGHALGLSQTYVARREGKGVRGEEVPEIDVQVNKLRLNLPNISAGELLAKTRDNLAGRYLIALSLWEEEQEEKQSSGSTFSGDIESFLEELQNAKQKLDLNGVTLANLRSWAEVKKERGDKRIPDLPQNRSRRGWGEVLFNSGLINIDPLSGRMSMTPLGRVIADWLKSEMEGDAN